MSKPVLTQLCGDIDQIGNRGINIHLIVGRLDGNDQAIPNGVLISFELFAVAPPTADRINGYFIFRS